MKTPDEIKIGLGKCYGPQSCAGCPYYDLIDCNNVLLKDALTYIEQIEERTSLNTLRDAIYEDAVKHGLYDLEKDVPEVEQAAVYLVSMIKFEIYEAWAAALDWEAHGSGAQDHFAEELADVIIMTLSACGHLGIDIDAAVRRKMEINKGRPWKHGKKNEGDA